VRELNSLIGFDDYGALNILSMPAGELTAARWGVAAELGSPSNKTKECRPRASAFTVGNPRQLRKPIPGRRI
jgi:hypothetical protein